MPRSFIQYFIDTILKSYQYARTAGPLINCGNKRTVLHGRSHIVSVEVKAVQAPFCLIMRNKRKKIYILIPKKLSSAGMNNETSNFKEKSL